MKRAGYLALVVLFNILVMVILLEILLRLYDPFRFTVQENSIKLRANYKVTFVNRKTDKLDSVIVFTKNSLGFRGPEMPDDFENYVSVITVGGSTTECFYSSDGKDWPALLYQLLKTDFDKVWVNNAGLDGHSTFGHQILLNDYIVKIRPKVLLLYAGINDMAREDLNEYDQNFLKGRNNTFLDALHEYSRVFNVSYNLLRTLRAKKHALLHNPEYDLKNIPLLRQSEEERQALLKKCEEKWIPQYRQRLQRLIDTCRRYQIEPVLITQPALYGEGTDTITGANLEEIKVWDYANGKTVWNILKQYNTATKEIAQRNNCLVLDIASVFPKNSLYFYDLMHYTNEGNEQLARMIYEGLKPWLTARFSPVGKSGSRSSALSVPFPI